MSVRIFACCVHCDDGVDAEWHEERGRDAHEGPCHICHDSGDRSHP